MPIRDYAISVVWGTLLQREVGGFIKLFTNSNFNPCPLKGGWLLQPPSDFLNVTFFPKLTVGNGFM